MDSVYSEVRAFVQGRIDAGVISRVEWLTAEYVETKGAIIGPNAEFYRACAMAHVKEVVKQVVGKYDSKPKKTDGQLVLPGFDHLQRAYTVTRDSFVLLIPVDQLTDDELLARASEYDEMAKGCVAHAREIREYVRARTGMAA